MSLTTEQLEEIYAEVSEMAGLFFSPEEIAINLGYNEEQTDEFVTAVVNKDSSQIVSSYLSGRLQTEIQLRKSIKEAALNGSNPAQQMMLNYQRQSRK